MVSPEQGLLSLVSTTEELLVRKRSGSGLEIWEYGRRDPSRWPRGNLYLQKLALTSPTSGVRVVGIVRSRTQATEFNLIMLRSQSCLFCLGWNLEAPGYCVPWFVDSVYLISRHQTPSKCKAFNYRTICMTWILKAVAYFKVQSQLLLWWYPFLSIVYSMSLPLNH
jgi:hypothetical protein